MFGVGVSFSNVSNGIYNLQPLLIGHIFEREERAEEDQGLSTGPSRAVLRGLGFIKIFVKMVLL